MLLLTAINYIKRHSVICLTYTYREFRELPWVKKPCYYLLLGQGLNGI